MDTTIYGYSETGETDYLKKEEDKPIEQAGTKYLGQMKFSNTLEGKREYTWQGKYDARDFPVLVSEGGLKGKVTNM